MPRHGVWDLVAVADEFAGKPPSIFGRPHAVIALDEFCQVGVCSRD